MREKINWPKLCVHPLPDVLTDIEGVMLEPLGVALHALDLAFEAAGENEAVEAAIQTTRPGRQVILIGIPKNDRTMFTASVARRKGLTIKIVHRMKHTYARAIDLVQKGYVDVQSLVTHRFPLSDFRAAFSAAKNREGIKVVIEF